uniref:Dolichyl-diphosphooligosaccharide--protein glycosyltransferase subunit 2 n=1 Tax=Cacopsylla melanoneura TaxID=428564 RepID=A0A8D8LI08_9HEMI
MLGKVSAGCLIICLSILTNDCHGAVSTLSYLKPNDKDHFKNVFTSGVESKDLSSVHYAVLGLKLLQSPVPKEQEVCKQFLDSSKNPTTNDVYYYAASGWKALQCKGAIVTPDLTKKLDTIVSQDTSSLADIYYASQALNSLAQKIQDPAKVVKNVKNLLKKDDSLANLGYALHIAALLGQEGSFMLDRIEDIIVQADEVDGTYLQFEGGLSTTALIVSGIYQLSQGLNKAPATLSGEQAVKFANYFVSRRSVTTPKGAYHLLNVAKIFTSNKFHIPVAISAQDTAVSLEQSLVQVSVTDVLGSPLPNTFTVTAESVVKVLDNVVVASKLKFTPVPSKKGFYSVNFVESKPEPGNYRFSVSAVPTPADAKLVGGASASLGVKVMCWLAVSDASVGTVDTERTTKPKLEPVTFPNKLSRPLEADSQQRLIFQFTLKDKQTAKPTTVHQTFVRLSNRETGQEVVLVVETPTSADKAYKFDVDIGAKSSLLNHQSGLYTVSLIVGDAVVTNSFVWEVGTVNLKLSGDVPAAAPHTSKSLYYKPKPEITHMFREAERRPPVFVSNLFTGLVLLPILLLFILWGKLGVNISNFPFKFSALMFHVCLGGIFVLFGLFWLQLNMFETLKYLTILSVFTFYFGNSLLSHIASSKKH